MISHKVGDKVKVTNSPFYGLSNGQVLDIVGESPTGLGWVSCKDSTGETWPMKQDEV